MGHPLLSPPPVLWIPLSLETCGSLGLFSCTHCKLIVQLSNTFDLCGSLGLAHHPSYLSGCLMVPALSAALCHGLEKA